MKVLIRFKGGGCGETLTWVIDEMLNVQEQTDNIHNRRRLCDVFKLAFQSSLVPVDFFPERIYSRWDDVPEEVLRNRVNEITDNSPKQHYIGKAHHTAMKATLWPRVFVGWTIFDIVPQPSRMWTIHTLQFYRSGLLQCRRLDQKYAVHPDFKDATAFFERHGWIPEYWDWIMSRSDDTTIHDVDLFFKRHTKIGRSLKEFTTLPCDFRIEASRLFSDRTLTQFRRACSLLGGQFNTNLMHDTNNWVEFNRSIYAELGLLDMVDGGNELNEAETCALMKDLFRDKALALASGAV